MKIKTRGRKYARQPVFSATVIWKFVFVSDVSKEKSCFIDEDENPAAWSAAAKAWLSYWLHLPRGCRTRPTLEALQSALYSSLVLQEIKRKRWQFVDDVHLR